jgi:DNA-binding MarR family transcriptional regulator
VHIISISRLSKIEYKIKILILANIGIKNTVRMEGIMDQVSYENKSTKELFLELARVYFVKRYKVTTDKGMHQGQEALLELVSKESGLSQKEIAKKLKIKPPTVAVSIKRMEKTGWIVREIDSVDKRISRVFITDEGKELLDEVKSATKDLDKLVFAGISEVEKCLLRRILIQLIQNIRKTIDDKEMNEVMEHFSKHHEHKHAMHHKIDK